MLLEHPGLLITDDDADLRTTLCEVFRPRGFRTLTAGDGEEALDIVAHEPVHILLLDMHMPRLDGLQTIRRVKEMQLVVPCILMSAGMNEQLAEQARQAEVFSTIAKPVRLREMVEAVERALDAVYRQ